MRITETADGQQQMVVEGRRRLKGLSLVVAAASGRYANPVAWLRHTESRLPDCPQTPGE
jgi:hypothetical protein